MPVAPPNFDQEWYALTPLLQVDAQDYGGMAHVPPSWRLLLLGDGYTTRNLNLLIGATIQAEHLASSPIDAAQETVVGLEAIAQANIRRQVCLRSPSGQPLLYAASWWNHLYLERYLPNPNLPIGQSLARQHTEVYRQILSLVWGHSHPLEALLGQPAPFWGRTYLLYQQQQPITLISEVFSPLLAQYLGIAPAPSLSE